MFLAFFCLLFAIASCNAAEVHLIDSGSGAVDVRCEGELFTRYVYQETPKPILYPILGPGGVKMTRDYPMATDTPGEEHDHPHHRSLWFAHGDVNGFDFWLEGPDKGRIVHQDIKSMTSGTRGELNTISNWVAPSGEVICRENRLMGFEASEGFRMIDLEIELMAGDEPMIFGDTKEGTMAIRMRPELRLDRALVGAAGQAINSNGVRGREVWGKRAEWIDYFGIINGSTLGIAIFDSPDNPRYPTTWHARDYGLVAANPFGLHDFLGAAKGSGQLSISSGETITFSYRFIFHRGDAATADISKAYKVWARKLSDSAR